jgi:UDP-N-acetylmuramoylalanine--D-glutamate ligase
MSGVDLVLGLGSTGLACARFLQTSGRSVVINDSRSAPPMARRLRREQPQIEMHLGGFDMSLLDRVDRVVLSPGIMLNEPMVAAARDKGLAIVSDIDLFFEQRRAPVAGITGSNGKSTVTCWLDAVLSAAGKRSVAGGNLGTPALDLLESTSLDNYVLELSSFQLERSSALPLQCAALLNLSADHLDHHGDMAAYAAAKARIFDHADVAVVARELIDMVPASVARVITFGLDAPQIGHYGLREHDNQSWLAHGDRLLIATSSLRMSRRHDVLNALAVLALAEGLGVSWPAAHRGLVDFGGLAHRMQEVAQREGVIWINDSKGTNVGASVAAIRSVGAPLVLIAGGDAKGSDLTPLAQVMRGRARAAVVLGKDAPALATALEGVCDVHAVDDIESAVRCASVLARSGDTVLLSPACSSLDMHASFEERGDRFAAAVETLA